MEHQITRGMSTIYRKEVGASDTLPQAGGSGIMDFLVSTPAILTMIIEASSELLDSRLPENYITVGKRIELSHDRPTVIGETVTIILTVISVKDEHITLELSGHDSSSQICSGRYERVIVNKDELIQSAYSRIQGK